MDLEHLPAQSLHSNVHTEPWPTEMPAYSDDAVHQKDVTGPYCLIIQEMPLGVFLRHHWGFNGIEK